MTCSQVWLLKRSWGCKSLGEMRKGPLAIEEISDFPALNVTSAVRRSLSTTRAAASGAETDSGSTNGERANCGISKGIEGWGSMLQGEKLRGSGRATQKSRSYSYSTIAV